MWWPCSSAAWAYRYGQRTGPEALKGAKHMRADWITETSRQVGSSPEASYHEFYRAHQDRIAASTASAVDCIRPSSSSARLVVHDAFALASGRPHFADLCHRGRLVGSVGEPAGRLAEPNLSPIETSARTAPATGRALDLASRLAARAPVRRSCVRRRIFERSGWRLCGRDRRRGGALQPNSYNHRQEQRRQKLRAVQGSRGTELASQSCALRSSRPARPG